MSNMFEENMKKTCWSDSLRFFVYWLCAPFHWFWRAQWLISLKPHNPCQRVLTPHEFKLSMKAALSRGWVYWLVMDLFVAPLVLEKWFTCCVLSASKGFTCKLAICVVIDYIRTLYTFYVQQLAVQLFVSHWEPGHIVMCHQTWDLERCSVSSIFCPLGPKRLQQFAQWIYIF